jgi:hypothetical protein
MFRKPGAMDRTRQRMADIQASGNLLEILKGVEKDIASIHGFHGAPVYVSFEGQRVSLDDLILSNDLQRVDLNQNSNSKEIKKKEKVHYLGNYTLKDYRNPPRRIPGYVVYPIWTVAVVGLLVSVCVYLYMS